MSDTPTDPETIKSTVTLMAGMIDSDNTGWPKEMANAVIAGVEKLQAENERLREAAKEVLGLIGTENPREEVKALAKLERLVSEREVK